MKVCAYRDCEQEFDPARHNQKYCNSQCCKDEMNARAKDAYAEKRDRRRGKERKCKHCDARLSKYNDADVCMLCSRLDERIMAQEVWDIINA